MKKKISILLGVLLCMFLIPGKIISASENKEGAIIIQLNDLGTPMEDVEFTLYEVTETGETKDTGITGKTDTKGNLIFDHLKEGEYLIAQSNTASYGKVSSFLFTIPYIIEGKSVNEIVAHPKGEIEETPAEETENVETISAVKTGDASSILLYLVLASGALLYAGGIAFYKKRKAILNVVIVIVLATAVAGTTTLSVFAEEESTMPVWATNVTIENLPDEQYIYQFSNSCPLYQRGQYRFGCGAYDCAPSPIILLIDGSECDFASGKTWTANTIEYTPGVSNYELAYCADFDTSTVADQFYKKVNVEDATYFENVEDAYKLRAIVGNTYPFVPAVDMVKELHAENIITNASILLNGKTFSDELTTEDIDVGQLIAATQMAIWVVCNDTMDSASVTAGTHTYYTLHPSNTNMQPQGKLNPVKGYLNANDETQTEFDMTEEQAANINAIYNYLMGLAPVTEEEADKNQQLVITDVEYQATKTGVGNYDVIVRTSLNTAIKKNDNLTMKVSASKPDSEGNVIEETKVFTDQGSDEVLGKEFTFYLQDVPAAADITIELSGEQYLNQGVYFYEPYVAEGETQRSTSQNLVGASVGYTPVKATANFNVEDEKVGAGISVLPSTGGSGTGGFYLLGGSIFMCIFILSVRKYRTKNVQK